LKFLLLATLFIVAACVPKAEEIQGCGSGQEFSDFTKSCIAATSIRLDSTPNTLTVTEDDSDGEAFTLPTATSTAPENQLYWFITEAPENGVLTDCADLNVSGVPSGTGTVLRSCVYTPDASYVGTDSFTYRVCDTTKANKRCTESVTVTVTVEDDEADMPTLVAPTAVTVQEGNTFTFGVRVQRQTADESDNFYLCVDLTDASSALDTPTITNVNNPGDALAFGEPVCSLLGDEADSLTNSLATIQSDTNFLPTNANRTATFEIRLCEADLLPDCVGTAQTVTTTVTVANKNFSPVMATAAPPLSPKTLNAIDEDSGLITIGTAEVNSDLPGPRTRELEPSATDADPLDTVTYEYVPLSFFPVHSGTLICTPGSDLSCTFTPAANYSGNMTFRYRAKDDAGALSSEVSVTMTVTAINDAPSIISGQVFDYATPASQVALNENTTLANRTMVLSEGGGASENSQVLRLRASTDNLVVLPPSRITVKRNGAVIGTLDSVTELQIDTGIIDADAQSFTLSFAPVADMISETPINVELYISDGTATVQHDFAFTSVVNIDSPIIASIQNPGIGIQQSATSKDLILRASPGVNDWDDIPNGSQNLTVTVTSATPSVIDLTEASMTFAGIGVTSITPSACSASSCTYTIVYNGTDDPVDDNLVYSLEPSARGTSLLTFTFSDGVGTNVVRSTTVGVYNFAVSFLGWSDLKAKGMITDKTGAMISEPSATISWENLVVTEGGVATTDYKVRVYRNNTNNFATYPVTGSVETDGVASTTKSFTLTGGITYDDASTISSGDSFYVALAVVPTKLDEEIYPSNTPDRALEVVIPPDNMALVHAWIANKAYCTKTGQTADRSNNYRCRNTGLGGKLDTGVWYHELETHTLVDIYEAGCPYQHLEDTRTVLATGIQDDVHYERDTGECVYSDDTNWQPFDATIAAVATVIPNAARLPPLVGLTRATAQAVCEAQTPTCSGAACAGAWAGIVRELPTRSESLRIADWETSYTAPLTAEAIEDSANHTSTFACNTKGIDQAANRFAFGDPSFSATSSFMPGSPSSSIYSFLTGSSAAANCASRYGALDMVGNVAEWQADVYSCTDGGTTASCEMLAPVQAAASLVNDDSSAANNSLGVTYAFDGSVQNGPQLTKDVAATIASLFTADVDRLYVAAGLPFVDDSGVPHPSIGLPRIGTIAPPASQGTAIFSSDSYLMSWNGVSANYAMVHGGNWESLAGAGRFSFELMDATETSTKVGHRCVMRRAANP
jgi:hypothetical protein